LGATARPEDVAGNGTCFLAVDYANFQSAVRLSILAGGMGGTDSRISQVKAATSPSQIRQQQEKMRLRVEPQFFGIRQRLKLASNSRSEPQAKE